MTFDEVAAKDYLTRLFNGSPGWYGLSWSDGGSHFDSDSFQDIGELLAQAAELEAAEVESIWVRMSKMRKRPGRGKKGGAVNTKVVPGIWSDIDLGNVGHKHDPDKHHGLRLPANEDEALSIREAAGLPEPTMVVHSGGGLYALWLFDEPYVLDEQQPGSLGKFHALERLVGDWQHQLAAGAERLGLYYGSGVGNLDRILRLPGTTNRKAGSERPCTLWRDGGPTYAARALQGALEDAGMVVERKRHHAGPVGAARHDLTDEEVEALEWQREHNPGPFDVLEDEVGIGGVLLAAGWTECECGGRGGVLQCFTRPDGGSTTPHSAHILEANPHVLVVFSEEAGLPAGGGQALTAGRIFAHLHHDGDMAAAAKDLRAARRGGGSDAAAGLGMSQIEDTPDYDETAADVFGDDEAGEEEESVDKDSAEYLLGGGPTEPKTPAPAAPVAEKPKKAPKYPPRNMEDSTIVEWLADVFQGRMLWTSGLGWCIWNGRWWASFADGGEVKAKEKVRLAVKNAVKEALTDDKSAEYVKKVTAYLDARAITRVTGLLRGVTKTDGGASYSINIDPSRFDNHPDLLNCWNGVVDLRTGELLPHDPDLLLTKITRTSYTPGARHEDWDQVLSSLDPEVMDWMQVRFGQGVTGYLTADDVMPIGQGGGSNGKSTLIGGLFTALGDHMVDVPEKLLRANPNEHPTELMTLRGSRLALVDETPEAAQLNVGRLKAVLGRVKLTARSMRKDFVTWDATHTLMVMTNYRPIINETDHGTWRRLALVVFDKKFPPNPMFRDRVIAGENGRAEAALAWVVEGAIRWYADKSLLHKTPNRVQTDTLTWRMGSDMVLAYLTERLEFDPNASVLSSELLEDFNEWLAQQGLKAWSSRLFKSRFGGHDTVTKVGVVDKQGRGISNGLVLLGGGKPTNKNAKIWSGVKWRPEAIEKAAASADTPENAFSHSETEAAG